MRDLSGVVKEPFGCERDGDDDGTHSRDHPRRGELQSRIFPFPTPTHFPSTFPKKKETPFSLLQKKSDKKLEE